LALRPSALMVGLALWLVACQGPPPVGRAADPTPQSHGGGQDSESAELLRQVDGLQQQLKQQPRSRPLKIALGKLYYENQRFLEAAVQFREALDEQPDDVENLKLLANCMFFLGNPDVGIKLHSRVLEIDPKDIDAQFFLGAILVESRPQDREALTRAVAAWEKFVELAPNHPRRKDIEEQLDVIRKAAKGEITLGTQDKQQRPQQPQGGGGGGGGADEGANEQGAMGGQKSFAGGGGGGGGGGGPGAFKKGERVPRLPADAKPMERKRAEALDALDEQRWPDAKEAAEFVLKTEPGDNEMGVARARSMVQLGESEQAIRAFGEVIKRNPKYPQAWHYLGMAHMMAGDPKRAAQTWRDLIAMDPDYARQNRLEQRAQMAERMSRSQ
jgi:cytochrome c-type biogenesis protein CcmH/NrfG